jgi:hypothetical protein
VAPAVRGGAVQGIPRAGRDYLLLAPRCWLLTCRRRCTLACTAIGALSAALAATPARVRTVARPCRASQQRPTSSAARRLRRPVRSRPAAADRTALGAVPPAWGRLAGGGHGDGDGGQRLGTMGCSSGAGAGVRPRRLWAREFTAAT